MARDIYIKDDKNGIHVDIAIDINISQSCRSDRNEEEEEQNERNNTASEILRSSTIIFRGKIYVFKISNFMYPRHHNHQDKQMHVVVISLRHMSS